MIKKTFASLLILAVIAAIPLTYAGMATPVPYLVEKDPNTWQPVPDGAYARFYYLYKSGSTVRYAFIVRGLAAWTSYSLIYYADPWPGNNPGALICTFQTDGAGSGFPGYVIRGQSTLAFDLPHPSDANYPAGAKLWIVLSSDYDAATNKMTAWNPTEYLFEWNLITLSG